MSCSGVYEIFLCEYARGQRNSTVIAAPRHSLTKSTTHPTSVTCHHDTTFHVRHEQGWWDGENYCTRSASQKVKSIQSRRGCPTCYCQYSVSSPATSTTSFSDATSTTGVRVLRIDGSWYVHRLCHCRRVVWRILGYRES